MTKLTEEQCAELERKARNCRDNARAELVVHDTFIEEYPDDKARAALQVEESKG